MNNTLDVANLFENLASNFAGVVQYNKDNSPHATITIDQVQHLFHSTLSQFTMRLGKNNIPIAKIFVKFIYFELGL